MKLLLAEDEKGLSEAICDILKYNKYLVEPVYNGADALEYARLGDYDGLILDIMMPKMSGLEVLEILRREGYNKPILLLTAKSETEDIIAGLDVGADDYIPKPFAMGELLARIRAMLRRNAEFTPDSLSLGNVTLDRNNSTISANGITVDLSNLEFRIIEHFMINRGIYISSEDLLAKVWGYDSDAEIGAVWVYISYLRKKLSSINANIEIKAKRGVGYTISLMENEND